MRGELFPRRSPLGLRLISRRLPKGPECTDAQLALVATIVHNTGIYNAIVSGGLFWAAAAGDPARDVARVLLAGAALAGVFGTATSKSHSPRCRRSSGRADRH